MVDDNSATGQSSIFWADMQLYVANRSEVKEIRNMQLANRNEVKDTENAR
jgi:hypothetical protein